MHVSELRKKRLAGDAPGPVELRDSQQALYGFLGDFPQYHYKDLRPGSRHGALIEGTRCGKCGCQFVNVGCPKLWPISTIVLTCSMCGSVVTYVDGCLLLTEKRSSWQAAKSDWKVRNRIAYELQPYVPKELKNAAALAGIGHDLGMSDKEIADELHITEKQVKMLLDYAKK